MDLDDGVESTPGLMGDQTRIVPFLGAHNFSDKQQQNCCKPTGQNLQQRHNSALAVSIETDVWLLGKTTYSLQLYENNKERSPFIQQPKNLNKLNFS